MFPPPTHLVPSTFMKEQSPLDLTFQTADKPPSEKRYTFSFDLIHGALSVFSEIWLPSLHHISSSPASCGYLAEFQLK